MWYLSVLGIKVISSWKLFRWILIYPFLGNNLIRINNESSEGLVELNNKLIWTWDFAWREIYNCHFHFLGCNWPVQNFYFVLIWPRETVGFKSMYISYKFPSKVSIAISSDLKCLPCIELIQFNQCLAYSPPSITWVCFPILQLFIIDS